MTAAVSVQRMTQPTRKTLKLFLAAPHQARSAPALIVATNLKSGTLYPLLTRLVQAGWLAAEWEQVPGAGPRPIRLYRLSEKGRELAMAAIEMGCAPAKCEDSC